MSGRMRRVGQRNTGGEHSVRPSMSRRMEGQRLTRSEAEGGQVHVPEGTWIHNVRRGAVAGTVLQGNVASETTGEPASRASVSSKKEKQWYTWAHRVIPALVGPYASLLNKTQNLASLGPLKKLPVRCSGCLRGSVISVICLYFDSGLRELKHIVPYSYSYKIGLELRKVCTCSKNTEIVEDHSVAEQLLDVGLFPCAPIKPSFAVDLDFLQFVSTLFQNISPNITGLSTAIEQFLDQRQFQLGTVVSLELMFYN